MLTADVLDSDATLNHFEVIGSLQFIPGEDITLFIRLKQPQRGDLRFVPPATTILTVSLPNKDGTTTDLVATSMVDDRSIWSVLVSDTVTPNLSSGNLTFSLDLLGDGSKFNNGWIQNGLTMIVTGAC